MRQARSLLFPLVLSSIGLVVACAADDDSDGAAKPDSGTANVPSSTNNGFDRDDNRDDRDDDDRDDDDTAETSNPPIALPPAVPVPDPERTQCGDMACRDTLVGDIVVQPCCPSEATDRCGLDLNAVTGFMSLQGGCTELEKPGQLDPVCPSVFLDDAVNPRELAGCCNAQAQCGVMADLSDLLANFGCVDPDTFIAGRAPASPPAPTQSSAEPQNDGVHLLDGGGYFVSDAGLDASTAPSDLPVLQQECTPPPPPPDPVDAGSPDAADAATPLDAGDPSSTPDSGGPTPPLMPPSSDAGLDASSVQLETDSGGAQSEPEPASDASAPSAPPIDAAADAG
jgi:hypothetical protein